MSFLLSLASQKLELGWVDAIIADFKETFSKILLLSLLFPPSLAQTYSVFFFFISFWGSS